MKTLRLRTLRRALLLFLALGGTTARAQQEIYNHFSTNEKLNVAYVTDFRVDSVVMDVIFIAPQDSTAWVELLKEIGVIHSKKSLETMGKWDYVTYRCDRHPQKNFLKGTAKIDAASYEKSGTVIVNQREQKVFVWFPRNDEQNYKVIQWMFKW